MRMTKLDLEHLPSKWVSVGCQKMWQNKNQEERSASDWMQASSEPQSKIVKPLH